MAVTDSPRCGGRWRRRGCRGPLLGGVQLVLEQDKEFLHGARDPVGLDHECVAGLEHGQCLAQLRPVTACAGGLHDDLAAVGCVQCVQCVELELVILRSSGHPGVADPDGVGARHPWIVSQTVPELNARHPVAGRIPGRPAVGVRDCLAVVPDSTRYRDDHPSHLLAKITAPNSGPVGAKRQFSQDRWSQASNRPHCRTSPHAITCC